MPLPSILSPCRTCHSQIGVHRNFGRTSPQPFRNLHTPDSLYFLFAAPSHDALAHPRARFRYHVAVLQSFERYLRKHRLIRAGQRVGVAVSGGADSVALLRALATLAPASGSVPSSSISTTLCAARTLMPTPPSSPRSLPASSSTAPSQPRMSQRWPRACVSLSGSCGTPRPLRFFPARRRRSSPRFRGHRPHPRRSGRNRAPPPASRNWNQRPRRNPPQPQSLRAGRLTFRSRIRLRP